MKNYTKESYLQRLKMSELTNTYIKYSFMWIKKLILIYDKSKLTRTFGNKLFSKMKNIKIRNWNWWLNIKKLTN